MSSSSINRILLFSIFFLLYLFSLYYSIYVRGFELDSDFLNYYLLYNTHGLNVDRWGVEITTPILFWIGKSIGLDFFGFVYVIGVVWLFPIFLLSRLVRFEYLLLYYLFFLIWFSPQYAFLMRHYLAVFFSILFFSVNTRFRYIFFFVSFLSHLAVVFIYIFSCIRFKHRVAYVISSFSSVFVFVLYSFGFSFISFFVGMSYHAGNYDIDRKLNTINNLEGGYSSGSYMVYFVLCLATVLHSFKIKIKGPVFSLERSFYFSALASLLLSEYVIFSNRVGLLAYFFSVPYLSIVISKYVFKLRSDKLESSLIN